MPDHYLHRSDTVYDTGLKMNKLLIFVYIHLDIFRQMQHNVLTETEAWLYFLGSYNPKDILRITDQYPIFRQLYQEIIDFRLHPKELISMYSEALKILDKNTVEYMIDELREQLDQQQKEHKAELARQKAESDAEIQQLREQLEKYKDKIAE